MNSIAEGIISDRPAPGWKPALVAFAVVVALVAALYWRTFASLVWVWAHDGTYQYAFLIFPLSAWTAFGLRHRLLASSPKPSVWGLAAPAGLSLLWFAGHLVSVNVVQHFALVAFFPALVLAFWGVRAVRVLAFPLGYLVFAIPATDSLVGPLQNFTASFAVKALNLSGVPVLLEGREITTATTTWMVGQACSGIKFFIACLALGCLFSYLMYQRWWKRLLFVGLSAVVPIIANGMRVYFTILIGDTFGLKYATGTDHMIFGWQFFGTVLLLLILVGWWWRDPVPKVQHPGEMQTGRMPPRYWAWIAALVLLALGPIWAFTSARSMSVPRSLALRAPPLAGWHGPTSADTAWHPHFAHADAHIHATYWRDAADSRVDLYAAVYQGPPRKGHALLTYGNDLFPVVTANVLQAGTRHLRLPSGRSINVREVRLGTANGVRVVWYWYQIDGRITVSPVLVKLLEAADVLRGKSPRASVWAISAMATSSQLPDLYGHMASFLAAFRSKSTDGIMQTRDVAQGEGKSL